MGHKLLDDLRKRTQRAQYKRAVWIKNEVVKEARVLDHLMGVEADKGYFAIFYKYRCGGTQKRGIYEGLFEHFKSLGFECENKEEMSDPHLIIRWGP